MASTLYHTSCTYEVDYIRRLLDIFGTHIQTLDTAELLAWQKKCDILVFSSNVLTWEQTKTLVAQVKPRIIFHMSEEEGTKPEFVDLSNMCHVVFRQHWFPDKYPHRHNLFHIPLGYMTGYNPTRLPKITFDKKYYTWSFIGAVNQARHEMLEAFTRHWPAKRHFVAAKNIQVHVMGQIYAQSIFVPNGRGCVRLDCFRIYEAIEAGAIPVTVGSEQELADTFGFHGDNLPMVTASSWQEALVRCDELLQDTEQLETMRQDLQKWMQNQRHYIQKRIAQALEAPLALYNK